MVPGINAGKSYNEMIREQLLEVDNNFKEVDFEKFTAELLSVRFELFALAWFHQFGEKSAITHAFFTKDYLTKKGMEAIWNSGEDYNQAIAQSVLHEYNPATRTGRARIGFVNAMRNELFKKYMDKNADNKCLARVLNKYGTESRGKKLSITLEYLGLSLCEKFDYVINEEARFRLTAILKGFYDGSKQSLRKIKV